MNQHPMSERDQDHPSLYGRSPLTRCLMDHQEVLWYQLILQYGYTPHLLRNKLDHHMLKQDSSILTPNTYG